MSTDTQPLEVDDDLVAEDGEEAAEAPIEVAKTNLAAILNQHGLENVRSL